jgi:hypothetical protein
MVHGAAAPSVLHQEKLIVQLLFWMDSRIYFTTVPLGEIGWYPIWVLNT